MTLKERIEDWKKYSNALGSEAQVAVIVGEVAGQLNEGVPEEVSAALKKLALRGTMRDLAAAIQRGAEHNPKVPSPHEVVETGAAAAGLSWTEAIATLARYLTAAKERLR